MFRFAHIIRIISFICFRYVYVYLAVVVVAVDVVAGHVNELFGA